jgi:post-segregation antitoxin (ccd killing protein)
VRARKSQIEVAGGSGAELQCRNAVPAGREVSDGTTAWLLTNARAIAEYNARVAVDGVFGDEWRTF